MIQYARQFSQPLSHLASMATVFQSGIASLERVLEFIDAEEQSPEPESCGAPTISAGLPSTTCGSPTTPRSR